LENPKILQINSINKPNLTLFSLLLILFPDWRSLEQRGHPTWHSLRPIRRHSNLKLSQW